MTSAARAGVDVLVVGAGPAGLSAAATAAECGASVLVVDGGIRPGGQIWRHREQRQLPGHARDLLARVRSAGAAIATGAKVIDVIGPRELVIDFHGRIARQHARSVVLATGAKERFLPFPGWTIPGVVGIGGLQSLIKSGLRLDGRRVVIAGSGPLLLPVAAAVVEAGGELVLVAEQASLAALARFSVGLAGKPGAIMQAIRYRRRFWSSRYRTTAWVVAAEGDDRLRGVTVEIGGRSEFLACDWLATGAGLVANSELAQLAGCELTDGTIRVDAQQATTVDGIWAAGECTGIKGDASAMVEGEIAGRAAVRGGAVSASALTRKRAAGIRFGRLIASTFALRPEMLHLADAATVVCRCEDVRFGDLEPSWTQRQAKLWTRIGMGECQGAVCGPACSALFGWTDNAIRPPLNAPLCGEWSTALTAGEHESGGHDGR